MIALTSLAAWSSALLLTYTYLGYPILAAVWARVRPRPIRRGDALPRVTILIAAFNEAAVIHEKLANTLSLDYPRELLEVIVVDDGSTDGTSDIARGFEDSGVRVLRQSRRMGKMAAVNRGVAAATTDLVVLSDASPLYEPNALRAAVRNFGDSEVGVVSGAIQVRDTASGVARPAGLYWRYEDWIRRSETRSGTTVGVNGNFFAFRRDLYEPPPAETVNDEFTIAMRIADAGHRVVYEPEAITSDLASPSMGAEFSRRARISAGRFQALGTGVLSTRNRGLRYRVFSHKLSRAVAPIAMLTFATATLLRALGVGGRRGDSRRATSLTVPTARRLVLLQSVLGGAALGGWFVEKTGRKPPRMLALPYYFLGSNLAALTGLIRHTRRGQSVAWDKPTVTPPEPPAESRPTAC